MTDEMFMLADRLKELRERKNELADETKENIATKIVDDWRSILK